MTQRAEGLAHSGNKYLSLGFRESDYTWEQALRILRKNRGFAIMIAGTLTALFVAAALMTKDSYRPVARLVIDAPSSGIKTLHEIESTTAADNQDYLETQVQILKSDALAVRVIRDLKLDRNASVNAISRADGSQNSQKNNASTNADIANGHSSLNEQLQLATLAPAEDAALQSFRKNLSVNVVRNTRLVEVGYAAQDPITAQRVTNAVVTSFIDNGLKHRYSTTMEISEWLSSQLNDLRNKLEASNLAVADYQKKYGLVELDDRDVPMAQLMSEVNHQLSDAQANRIEAEAFVRMIGVGETDSIPIVKDDQLYQNLAMRLSEARGQLAQAKTVYGDANINVKKLEEQASELGGQIEAERARIADRLRTSFAAAKERENLMLRNRERLRAQMGDVSSQLVGYHLLKNEAMANAELYNTLQGRLQEAGIYAGLKSDNIRVVDLATNLHKATSPNRAVLISSGALFACLIGILACFVRESFDNTVRTPDDINSWIGLRSLALLPASADGKRVESEGGGFGKELQAKSTSTAYDRENAFVLMGPLSAGAEAMRDLRTALLSSGSEDIPGVVLISSSMEGEGKTTVALNFALCLTQLGPTCLVDADLRSPALTKAFGIYAKPGLSEALSGEAQLASMLYPTEMCKDLYILPSGQPQESPADVLASPRIHGLCEDLRKRFKYVVIDSPPVIRFSDARFLSRFADEVVLVGRYGITTRRAVQRSAELLSEAHAQVAGFVLNGIDLSSSDYRYFTYGYSKIFNRGMDRYARRINSVPVGSTKDAHSKSKGAHV